MIGGEFRAGERLTGIAEMFFDNRQRPCWQVGARISSMPERGLVDATHGRRFSGAEDSRRLSVGLRPTPDSLF